MTIQFTKGPGKKIRFEIAEDVERSASSIAVQGSRWYAYGLAIIQLSYCSPCHCSIKGLATRDDSSRYVLLAFQFVVVFFVCCRGCDCCCWCCFAVAVGVVVTPAAVGGFVGICNWHRSHLFQQVFLWESSPLSNHFFPSQLPTFSPYHWAVTWGQSDLGEVVFQWYKRIYPCWIGFT